MATLFEAPISETHDAIMEILEAEDSAEENAAQSVDDIPADAADDEDVESDPVDDFDEDQSEDDDPEQELDEEPTYDVKVRGELRKVKLRELQDGYSRTEDYKAKTAEVAEMRRAAELEKQAYANGLNVVLQTAQQIDPILAEGRQTDWAALAKEDPNAYTEKKAQYDQRIAQLSHMAQERDRLNVEALQSRAKVEEDALIAARPEWADPDAGRSAMQAIRDALVDRYGFAVEDVQNIANHKLALVADDARKYHELLAKQEKARAKKTAPKPTNSIRASRKGTVSKADSAARSKARTGSLDDKHAYILSKL